MVEAKICKKLSYETGQKYIFVQIFASANEFMYFLIKQWTLTPKDTNVNEHLTNYVIRMSVSSSIGRNVSSTNHKFNAFARCSSTNHGHSFDAFAPNDLFNSSSTFTWDRRLCLKMIQGRLDFFWIKFTGKIWAGLLYNNAISILKIVMN